MPTIVCVSDTHGFHVRTEIPPGDVLIHAGDITRRGDLADVRAFDAWLGTLPHPHKIVIAGNHDWCFERDPDAARAAITNAVYLQDAAVTVAGLTVYGSPWQPRFHDWAFNLDRGPLLAEKWALIPPGIDVLVTHGPPHGIGDLCLGGDRAGCVDLLARVRVVRPKLHVFGHIHEAAGVTTADGTVFVNASTRMGHGRGIVVDVEG